VKTLAAWHEDAMCLSSMEFGALHPYPLLIHCLTSGDLHPVDTTGVMTVDRKMVRTRRHGDHRWSATLDAYEAAEVRGRNGDRSVDITVGSSQHCDIQLDDASVSRLHALLMLERDGWHVRDASSFSGTLVNDRRPGVSPLESGDRITFGAVDFVFMLPREVYQLVRGLDAVSNETTFDVNQTHMEPTDHDRK
jgi:FHA domain-containing protein